jgi:hypothetical protein
MNDKWTAVWRCHELDSAHEQEQWCRMFRNSVIRPRHELEMTHFALVEATVLQATFNMKNNGFTHKLIQCPRHLLDFTRISILFTLRTVTSDLDRRTLKRKGRKQSKFSSLYANVCTS